MAKTCEKWLATQVGPLTQASDESEFEQAGHFAKARSREGELLSGRALRMLF